MPRYLQQPERPLIYLITSGETNVRTTPASESFSNILRLIEAGVAAKIDLVQIREKELGTKVLYELATSAAAITSGSSSRLLVNDRADVAASAGADGVHLSTQSLPVEVIRRTFGEEFLIGVSTHSLEEVAAARDGGADFAVFGPVFDTSSKRKYGEPLGLKKLAEVTSELLPFPILALGGVTIGNAAECIQAGARGVAAIRMLNDPLRLSEVANEIRAAFEARNF